MKVIFDSENEKEKLIDVLAKQGICPADLGVKDISYKNCCADDEICSECWQIAFESQKIKTYEEGLRDAWNLARKIFITKLSTLQKVFCSSDEGKIIMNFEPQEAIAKLKAYEEEKEIKVGDVLENVKSEGVNVIVTSLQRGNMFNGIDKYGRSFSGRHLSHFKKTGKHIEITSILAEIGKE